MADSTASWEESHYDCSSSYISSSQCSHSLEEVRASMTWNPMESAAPVLMMIGIDNSDSHASFIPASQVCITSFCILPS
eukprot:8280948-Ditylum_brightwellii.AAC.2